MHSPERDVSQREGQKASHPNGPVACAEVLPKDRYTVLALCGLLLLAVALVFAQTLWFEFVFDDTLYVTENPSVQRGLTLPGLVWAFSGFHVSNWHPLTWLSHMLDIQCYDLWAGGHHLTNVLLHAVNVIVLFLVLRQMTGRLWPSVLVAALFAIHPLHVESVAWVAERKDVLSGLFFLLSLAAYLGYVRRPFSMPRYLLVVLCFALGLLCKPMLVTLPFVLLLLDYWPLRRWDPLDGTGQAAESQSVAAFPGRVLWEKVPLLLLTAASCLVNMLAQTPDIATMEQLSWTVRLANALVSYTVYLGQCFWPANLAAFYPHRHGNEPIWAVAGSLVLLAGLSVAAVAGRRRHPYLLVGWLWYLGMLVPVIGLVQVGDQARADRYMYLPSIGLSLILAWGTAELVGASPLRSRQCTVAWLLALAALTGLAGKQTSYWQNGETLWTHTLALTTGNSLAHNNLGVALAGRGQLDAAIVHYRQALEIRPDYDDAYYNLGNALARRGEVDAAIVHYRKALEIKPDWAKAHNNLGNALACLGRFKEALVEFEKTLEITPDSAGVHNNVGACLLKQGQVDAAIAQFQKALEIEPGNADARWNLEGLRAMQKKL